MMTRGTNVLFRDVSLILVAVLVSVIVILLPYLADNEKEQISIPPQGSMVFTISWDAKLDVDIDMWVKSIGAKETVGYSAKNSATLDLLRDDLGFVASNPDDPNSEVVYARKIVPGIYVLNAHYFSSGARFVGNVVVHGKIVVLDKDGALLNTIYEGSIVLKASKQEKTLVQFSVTESGNIISWSTQHHSIVNGVRIDD